MLIHLRAGFVLVIALAVVGSAVAQQPVSSEYLLPASTKAWFSVPSWSKLTENFDGTGPGQLAQNPEMKAFADSLRGQIDDYLDQRNFRLGVTIEDLRNLGGGEICFAGVLPDSAGQDGKIVRGSHGIILLVNVAGHEEAAQELLKKVGTELVTRNATEEPLDPIQGVSVQRYLLPLKNPAAKRYSLQAVSDGWLLASDNESIFRDVIRRLRNPDQAEALGRLSDDSAFQAIQKQAAVDGLTPDLNWFVEPFGYIQLSQAIADEDLPVVRSRNDFVSPLQRQGFDVFQALGGVIGFNQLEHDLVFRVCVHAPVDAENEPEKARCLRLFDLENHQKIDFSPEAFVPSNTDTWFTVTWNLAKTFENVGPIVDEFQKGTWDRLINGWEKDMGVDVNLLFKNLNNRVTIMTVTRRPIDENSERMAIAIPFTGDQEDIFLALKKMAGGDGKEKIAVDGKTRYLLVEKQEIDPELEKDLDDMSFLDEPVDSDVAQEETVKQFNLFEKKFFGVANSVLFIANQEDFLVELMNQTPTMKIAEADDYRQIRDSLAKFVNEDRLCAVEFGRNDQTLEVNYEMLRQDKMGSSQTSIARILNQVLGSEEGKNQPRAQKIDGTKLPSDYETVVAPYLGPSGWGMERTDSGWLVSGCVAKKKIAGELVRRNDEAKADTRR